jgi:hypothetical protein
MKVKILEHKWSSLAIFILIAFYLANSLKYSRWKDRQFIHDDVINYYSYLPAAIIFHDLSFDYRERQPENVKSKIYYEHDPQGRNVQKMTVGVAILICPFFLIAHLYSILNLLPANGYTSVYEFFIMVAALFYFLAGLIFLRRTLSFFFNDLIVALVLISLGAGTNLLCYTIYDSGMSHVYSFFLISLFLYLNLKWHATPNFKNSALLGLTGGLIALVRPSNAIIFIIPLLWGFNNKRSLIDKMQLIKNNFSKIAVITVFAFLAALPQLIYWHYATGNWIYYSYNNETFFFDNPHIFEGFFGFRKGFFIYTPLMLFILPGLFFSFRRQKSFAWSVFIFFIFNSYIIFSWWCWWYGGSFGSRPMIDSYSVLALPLGTFYSEIFSGKVYKKIFLSILIVFFILLNTFQTLQYHDSLMHFDSMNSKVYFKIFGTTKFPENYDVMLTHPDAERAKIGFSEKEIINLEFKNLKLLYSYKVAVKAANGKYLCADANQNGLIVCDRDIPLQWETFTMNRYAGKICTLASFQNKFAGIENDSITRLIAKTENPDSREMFRITDLGNNKFGLKSCDGTFISLDKNYPGLLTNGATKIGDSESFELILHCDTVRK